MRNYGADKMSAPLSFRAVLSLSFRGAKRRRISTLFITVCIGSVRRIEEGDYSTSSERHKGYRDGIPYEKSA